MKLLITYKSFESKFERETIHCSISIYLHLPCIVIVGHYDAFSDKNIKD